MTLDREADMRSLAAIRDTLELAVAEAQDVRRDGDAWSVALCVSAELRDCNRRLARELARCCNETPRVRLGDRWTVTCPKCGRTAHGETLAEAEGAWEGA